MPPFAHSADVRGPLSLPACPALDPRLRQERGKFCAPGARGWSGGPHAFSAADLDVACASLTACLASSGSPAGGSAAGEVPFDALQRLVGEVAYGGRVTDGQDRAALAGLLRRFLGPHALRQDDGGGGGGGFCAPPDGGVEEFRRHIRALPSLADAPELFALHANAAVALRLQETRGLLDALGAMQPRAGAAPAGGSPSGPDAAFVAALCADVAAQLPRDLSLAEARAGMFERGSGRPLDGLAVLLAQEVACFQRLAAAVRASLAELSAAVAGQAAMGEAAEATCAALLAARVPDGWRAAGYASPRGQALAAWLADLAARVAFVRAWLAGGPPPSFWLPALFNPRGLLTAVLQACARRHALPIDGLAWRFAVTRHASGADVPAAPEEGVLVHGLWLEGAAWDAAAGCLADAPPGVLVSPLPVLHCRPVPADDAAGDGAAARQAAYACPLYTAARDGCLARVDLPCGAGTPDAWLLQGVALVCCQGGD